MGKLMMEYSISFAGDELGLVLGCSTWLFSDVTLF